MTGSEAGGRCSARRAEVLSSRERVRRRLDLPAQALLECARYDGDGSLASRDWRTYAFPRAQHIPRLQTEHTVTRSPFTFHGIKGIGEAGAIGTPPAIVNAVLD